MVSRSVATTSILMAILVIPIMSQSALALNSLPSGMTLLTEQKKYIAGESVRLVGQIHDSVASNSLILLTVFDPNQQRVFTSKQAISSSTLDFSFPLDKKEARTGEWTINVRYSDMNENAKFMVVEKGMFDTAVLNKPVLKNIQGVALENPKAGQKTVISADLENDEHTKQSYVFVAQVIDAAGSTVMVSFITGTMASGATVSPSIEWQPSVAGTYVVQIMAWSSLAKPVPLDEKQTGVFEILA